MSTRCRCLDVTSNQMFNSTGKDGAEKEGNQASARHIGRLIIIHELNNLFAGAERRF
jgi:hypothetical protein